MGGLFGPPPAPKRKTEPAATALDDDPRPMPDPDNPLYKREAIKRRAKRSQASGRASTNLTSGMKRPEEMRSALGQV